MAIDINVEDIPIPSQIDSDYLIKESSLTSISNGIKSINGETSKYSPADMSDKLNTISALVTGQSNLIDSISSMLDGKGVPSGTLDITENGIKDVKSYANVNVNVAGGGGTDITSHTNITLIGSGMQAVVSYLMYPGDDIGSSLTLNNQTKTIALAMYVSIYGNYRPSVSYTDGDVFELGAMSGTRHYLILKDNITLTVFVSCLLKGTQVTLSDGTRKNIEDLTYEDKLKVWNCDEGKFDEADICWLTESGLHNNHYYKLTFSDGTILKTTGKNSNHKIYNVDERFFKGVDKTEIGDRIFSENGIVTVINKEYIEEDCEYYNLITSQHFNCFCNGILASDRYNNMYPIDEEMKYIKDDRQIRPYSEFESVGIKKYWYDNFRLGEQTESIESTIEYVNKCKCQMLDKGRINQWQ